MFNNKRIIRILAVKLLLGKKKEEFYDLIPLNNGAYMISIRLYEPADEFVARMKKALRGQG